MTRLIPGSSLWLLRYELLQNFRQSRRGNKKAIVISGGVLLLFMVVTGFPMALSLRHATFAASPPLILILDGIAVLLLTLMVSQALLLAVSTFYERGDLDLLLSSPLPPARILRIRWIGIAVSVASSTLVIATPLLLPIVILDRWQIVGAFCVIAALALLATATALLMASEVIQLIGPRRTRAVVVVLASSIGLMVFLVFEGINIFRDPFRPELRALILWLRSPNALAIFGPNLPWSWPARAALGDATSVIIFVGSTIVYYIVAVQFVGGRFFAQAAATIGSEVRGGGLNRAPLRPFRNGIRLVLLQKELRLIRRSPALLFQMALKPLYLVPVMFVLLSQALHGDLSVITVGVGIITFIASSLAGGLAGIAVLGEDVPDLLASAPVSSDAIRRAKLTSAVLPVVVLCSPVLAVMWLRPLAGIACIFGILAGGVSEGFIQLWYVKPTSRRRFALRGTGSLLGNLGGMLSDIGWAVTAGLLADGSVWSILVASLPVSVLFFLALNAPREDRNILVNS